MTNWDSNNKKTLNQTVPVKGVPFCTQTGMQVINTLVERTDTRIVIESEAHTFDSPYSDTFYVKEVWIVVTTEKNHPTSLFTRMMFVEFVKKTWFASQINEGAKKGVLAAHFEWL